MSFDDDNDFDINGSDEDLSSLFGSSDTSDDNDMFDFDTDTDGQDSVNQQSSVDLFDISEDDLDSALNGQQDDDDGETGQKRSVTKTAIIAIIIGIVVLVVILIIAGAVSKSKDNKDNTNSQSNNSVAHSNNSGSTTNGTDNTTGNVGAISGGIATADDWIKITSNEDVDFSDEYKTLTFMITSVEHFAKRVDAKGDMMIKTKLSGSLSGLSGTYSLDVPYEKGIKLSVGDEFAVKVLIGNYNGKSVIGDICC